MGSLHFHCWLHLVWKRLMGPRTLLTWRDSIEVLDQELWIKRRKNIFLFDSSFFAVTQHCADANFFSKSFVWVSLSEKTFHTFGFKILPHSLKPEHIVRSSVLLSTRNTCKKAKNVFSYLGTCFKSACHWIFGRHHFRWLLPLVWGRDFDLMC